MRRFHREARLLAAVQSPNVAQALDANVDDGIHYLVMELLEGESLRARIESGVMLQVEQALLWTIDVARGVADIHEQGIVHRDIKPDNIILIEREGQLRAVLARLYRRMARVVIARRQYPVSLAHPFERSEPLSGAQLARLEAMETQLHDRELDTRAIGQLGEILRLASPQELARLGPREVAGRFNIPEEELVQTFLHAAALGALVLRWDVICPGWPIWLFRRAATESPWNARRRTSTSPSPLKAITIRKIP